MPDQGEMLKRFGALAAMDRPPNRIVQIVADDGLLYALFADGTLWRQVGEAWSLVAGPVVGQAPSAQVVPVAGVLADTLAWAQSEIVDARAKQPQCGNRFDFHFQQGRELAHVATACKIEEALASSAPPSIANDLRVPAPGSLEGATLVPSAVAVRKRAERDSFCSECRRVSQEMGSPAMCDRHLAEWDARRAASPEGALAFSAPEEALIARAGEVGEANANAAVRGALAELREWARAADREAETTARDATTNLATVRHQGRQEGYRDTLDALDRLAERFK